MKKKKKIEVESMWLTDYGDIITQRIDYQKRITSQSKDIQDLESRLREMRKIVIGSDVSLRKLITHWGEPDIEAMDYLRKLFTRIATSLVREQGLPQEQEDYAQYVDFFDRFFYFAFWIATVDYQCNCIDDLIMLAECYRDDPGAFRVVVGDLVDEPIIVDEANNWVGYPDSHPQGPQDFPKYICATVAIFLGTMSI